MWSALSVALPWSMCPWPHPSLGRWKKRCHQESLNTRGKQYKEKPKITLNIINIKGLILFRCFLQLLLFIFRLSYTWINGIDPEYTSINTVFHILSGINSWTSICKNYLASGPAIQISITSLLQKASKAWRSRWLLPISCSPERAGKSLC